MERNEQTLQILLEEYRVLKSEQNSRIGFRDNLLYVTLGLFGTISSVAFAVDNGHNAFLVIPWVCLVMGWTYVVNDEKISAIGDYIRYTLEERISKLIGGSADNQYLFGWETAHRSDTRRTSRKYLQLCIDEITFVASGIVAVILFIITSTEISTFSIVISVIEIFLLLVLGFKIADYADLARGH